MDNGESIMLLHASDFHMREHETNALLHEHNIRQLFLFDAEQMAKDVGKPTVLIFSGDVAFSGKAEQYDVARMMFTDILQRLNLNEQRILVVPGNHDVDRPRSEGLAARMLRDQLRAGSEAQAEKVFVAKREELLWPLSAYQEFAMPYDCLIQGDNGYWEINNSNNSTASEYLAANFKVQIRGISTVHASDRNDDRMDSLVDPEDYGSHMYVARGQLSCDPLVNESPFRVLVGHHPPSWWRFSQERKNMMKARFHLHLFGHEHKFSPRSDGNAICVAAGAINPDDIRHEEARYNWIKVSRNNDAYTVRIWSRVFDHKLEQFVEDKLWPGGQGYSVSHLLDKAPIQIPPEDGDVAKEKQLEPTSSESEVSVEKLASTNTVAEIEKPISLPSAHAVRFSLLSLHISKYSKVFDDLGYSPTSEQKGTLGGLEYYEEALSELLLPENIGNLIAAMKKANIDVN